MYVMQWIPPLLSARPPQFAILIPRSMDCCIHYNVTTCRVYYGGLFTISTVPSTGKVSIEIALNSSWMIRFKDNLFFRCSLETLNDSFDCLIMTKFWFSTSTDAPHTECLGKPHRGSLTTRWHFERTNCMFSVVLQYYCESFIYLAVLECNANVD